MLRQCIYRCSSQHKSNGDVAHNINLLVGLDNGDVAHNINLLVGLDNKDVAHSINPMEM